MRRGGVAMRTVTLAILRMRQRPRNITLLLGMFLMSFYSPDRIHILILHSKSKLRKPAEVVLGPEYVGSRVSREDLLNDESDDGSNSDEEHGAREDEAQFADPDDVDLNVDHEDGDIDSDNALGSSDDERFKGFAFRGSGKPRDGNVSAARKRKTAADFMSDSDRESEPIDEVEDKLDGSDDDDVEESDGLLSGSDLEEVVDDEGTEESDQEDLLDGEDESDGEEETDGSSDEDEADGEAARRAELRKMMSEEQKTVVATISQAAKADADKGNAVKQQRVAFDSLLNVRIRLQKALVATNSMPSYSTTDSAAGEEAAPYQAAEAAAIKLWNTLDKLRHQLSKANSITAGEKRKRDIEPETPSKKIWSRMQKLETSNINVRQVTLEKWSTKVKSATAIPLQRKLNNTAATQTITDVLQEQLASSERLIARTHMPRSCAPLQAKAKLVSDPSIFDDADFYQLLLKELVDQRMMDSSAAAAPVGDAGRPLQWTAVKEAKTKKNVDTKASKGRKMRFTVHEKLQNFMAPDDRGRWEQDAVDRFFGTLFGQKMSLGEDVEVVSDGEEEDLGEEAGLMLFRS